MASSFPIWSGLVCRSYLLPGRDAADTFGDLPFHRSSVFGYLFKFGAYALGDGMTETGHYVKIFTYPLGFSRKGVVRGHHQIRRQERVDRYSIGESFDRASNFPGSAETFGQAPIGSHPPCRGEHPPVRKAGRQITVKAPGQIQAGSGPPRTGGNSVIRGSDVGCAGQARPGPGKHPTKQWDTHHYEWIQAKTPGGEASSFTGCSRCRLGTSAGAFANGACISEWTADVYEREANSSGGLPSFRVRFCRVCPLFFLGCGGRSGVGDAMFCWLARPRLEPCRRVGWY